MSAYDGMITASTVSSSHPPVTLESISKLADDLFYPRVVVEAMELCEHCRALKDVFRMDLASVPGLIFAMPAYVRWMHLTDHMPVDCAAAEWFEKNKAMLFRVADRLKGKQ